LHETLYAGHVNPFAEASELFMHTVLQLIVSTKWHPWSASFRDIEEEVGQREHGEGQQRMKYKEQEDHGMRSRE
jgi:hypothetical protein